MHSSDVFVTHPFHPLFGQRLAVITVRHSRHGDRVWYSDSDGARVTIPRNWTSLADVDPWLVVARARAHFRISDLEALVAKVAALRASDAKGGPNV